MLGCVLHAAHRPQREDSLYHVDPAATPQDEHMQDGSVRCLRTSPDFWSATPQYHRFPETDSAGVAIARHDFLEEISRVKRLVAFLQEDATSLVVEIDEPLPEGGVVRAARPGEIAERATQTFEAALSKIKPMARAIFTTLRDLAQCLEQIRVEFGVKITANAGLCPPLQGVEGNDKVTLSWTPAGCQRQGE